MKRSFSDQFREAVLNAGETRYSISKATGISESILSRFVHGKAGLSMDYMDRLAAHLGLKLIAKTKKTRKRSQKETK